MAPKRNAREQHEHFRFAADEWDFDYGFHVDARDRPIEILGPCWESTRAVISGKLRSKSRRACSRVEVTVTPDGFEPKNWKPGVKGLGTVVGVRRGVLKAYVRIPTGSFQVLVSALGAGKVRGISFSVEREPDKKVDIITSLFTIDPDEDDEE